MTPRVAPIIGAFPANGVDVSSLGVRPMEPSTAAGNQRNAKYWIVICPEPSVRGGLWARWYRERCVAVGWYPPTWSFEGQGGASEGWGYARNRLKEMQPGDKVIPFLLKWRIGPVGTIRELKVKDSDWNPTVGPGDYNENEPEVGRRILVDWETDSMPPDGMVATVPSANRIGGKQPLARHTIEEISPGNYLNLRAVLADSRNWSMVGSAPGADPETGEGAESEVPPPPPPPAALSLLERDLQKFLSRNLDHIEKGLKPDPAYQLEEYSIDVGRIDLLCRDAHNNWVVIELKADWAADDAVGQILGYMSWVKENLPNGSTVRGIIVCRNTTGRVRSAARLVPSLSIKRFALSFSVENFA